MGNNTKIENITLKIEYTLESDNKKLITQNTNAFIFILNDKNKLLEEKALIYYNNKKSFDNSIELTENRSSQTKYLEVIKLDFNKIDKKAKRVRVFISLYKSEENKIQFGEAKNITVSFIDNQTKEELAIYKPENSFLACNFISLVEFIFEDKWEIQAIGEGYKSDFNEFISNMFADEKELVSEKEKKDFENWCYKTLECTKESTNEELKNSYKHLVKSFHPDSIQALNLHNDFVVFAKEKFMNLKKAYDYLKKLRKL